MTTERKQAMAQAKQGDTVKVHYTGTLDDGTVFDTSVDRDPLQFTVGEGKLIPQFEQTVVGMTPGESKSVQIVAENAYGPYREGLVITLNREQLPANVEFEINQHFQLMRNDEEAVLVRVADTSETTVTMDANHPLAGQDLSFEIQLVEIT